VGDLIDNPFFKKDVLGSIQRAVKNQYAENAMHSIKLFKERMMKKTLERMEPFFVEQMQLNSNHVSIKLFYTFIKSAFQAVWYHETFVGGKDDYKADFTAFFDEEFDNYSLHKFGSTGTYFNKTYIAYLKSGKGSASNALDQQTSELTTLLEDGKEFVETYIAGQVLMCDQVFVEDVGGIYNRQLESDSIVRKLVNEGHLIDTDVNQQIMDNCLKVGYNDNDNLLELLDDIQKNQLYELQKNFPSSISWPRKLWKMVANNE
jgi:hypothetical protein